jgi:hypothetical protein
MALILLSLGVGFGLSSVSPWQGAAAAPHSIGGGSIIWLILTQAIAAGLSGYIAGRLRTRWPGLHGDEVYFRDTAHGFLVWAVAVVATAALLTSAAASLAGAGRSVGDNPLAAGEPATAPERVHSWSAYYVDRLLRVRNLLPDAAANAGPAQPVVVADIALRAQLARALEVAARSNSIASDDRAYLDQLVAARTGLGQSEAEARVDGVIGEMRVAADEARMAGAKLSLWIFVSLLIGAFCGSVAALFGGRGRDRALVMEIPATEATEA